MTRRASPDYFSLLQNAKYKILIPLGHKRNCYINKQVAQIIKQNTGLEKTCSGKQVTCIARVYKGDDILYYMVDVQSDQFFDTFFAKFHKNKLIYTSTKYQKKKFGIGLETFLDCYKHVFTFDFPTL